jgi:predicted nucleic acid-binding protein
VPKRFAVIDANLAVKTVIPNVMRAQCYAALNDLMQENYELEAPTLWAYETTSAICKAVHFAYLTEDEGWRALQQLAALDVTLRSPDVTDNQNAMKWTLTLKRAAAYDSYYLALAERLGCELWTADQRLVNAAGQPWVRWVGDAP